MNPEDSVLSEIRQSQRQILQDSTYMKQLKQSGSQKQKVEWRLPELGNVKWGNCCWKTVWWFLKKLKIELP